METLFFSQVDSQGVGGGVDVRGCGPLDSARLDEAVIAAADAIDHHLLVRLANAVDHAAVVVLFLRVDQEFAVALACRRRGSFPAG